MKPVGKNHIDLNLTPSENVSANATAKLIWNLHGSTVPPGAYNALDPRVKNAYDELKKANQSLPPDSPGMYTHSIDVPRRPRS